MKNLVIIGAGPMGREACHYARECGTGLAVKGFLDTRANLLDGFAGYPPVLGDVAGYAPEENDVFVCAVGDPAAKMRYAEEIAGKGGKFVSLVHPKAYVGMNTSIGEGSIIAPGAVITTDAAIGKHVIVNVGSTISHDCAIGDGTTISPGCHIAGNCSLGPGTFLGTGANLIPHVKLGGGAEPVYVAAGATVVKSFETGLLMGVPAKPKERMAGAS